MVRITRAGAPMISECSGNCLPSVMTDPGADDAAAADFRAVHDDRTHPDQRAILEGAAVQDDVVTDRAVLADGQRKSLVGVAGRVVLHIGALADLDPLIVAAQDRAEPDAR